MPGDGTPYDEVARVLDEEDESRYDEVGELLDRARADGETLFRARRFRYALYRHGWPRDEGAVTRRPRLPTALWQVAEDEEGPQLPRHPDVGSVHTDH